MNELIRYINPKLGYIATCSVLIKYYYSGTWHLETRDIETWLDRTHHCSEKVACLIKYVDLIGYIGIFDSTLGTGNIISIHIRVSR